MRMHTMTPGGLAAMTAARSVELTARAGARPAPAPPRAEPAVLTPAQRRAATVGAAKVQAGDSDRGRRSAPAAPVGTLQQHGTGPLLTRGAAVKQVSAELRIDGSSIDAVIGAAARFGAKSGHARLEDMVVRAAGFEDAERTPGYLAVAAGMRQLGLDPDAVVKFAGGGAKGERALVSQWPALKARQHVRPR